MNTHYQTNKPIKSRREPLYASPWIALFFMLREELTQSRKTAQENPCA